MTLTFNWLRFSVPALGILVFSGCSDVQDTRPGKPVATRQTAFKEMLRSFEPMGVNLRESTFNAADFEKQAKLFAEHRDTPWHHFGPDTNYPPTKAKAAVWEDPSKFEQAVNAFKTRVDQLSHAAASHDEKGIKAAYDAVHEACKSCHKSFRGR